jgi:hypothetical protein
MPIPPPASFTILALNSILGLSPLASECVSRSIDSEPLMAYEACRTTGDRPQESGFYELDIERDGDLVTN